MLPSDFLEKYEAELGFIVLQNPDNRMGLDGIKARLAHIAGIDGLTVEHGNAGAEIYRLGDQIIKVPPGNAGVRSRVQALAGGLRSVQPVEVPTAKVDAAVAAMQTKPKSETRMSVTGIQSGAFQTKLAEMRQKIADKQTEALTKIDGAVTSGAAKMNAAVDDVVAKADKEVDAALHEFAQFTNGPEA